MAVDALLFTVLVVAAEPSVKDAAAERRAALAAFQAGRHIEALARLESLLGDPTVDAENRRQAVRLTVIVHRSWRGDSGHLRRALATVEANEAAFVGDERLVEEWNALRAELAGELGVMVQPSEAVNAASTAPATAVVRAEPVAPKVVRAEPVPAPSRDGLQRGRGYRIGGGVVVALGGVFAGVTVAALAQRGAAAAEIRRIWEVDSALGRRTEESTAENHAARESMMRADRLAAGAGVAAAVLLATGIGLVIKGQRMRRATWSVAPAGLGLGLAGRF